MIPNIDYDNYDTYDYVSFNEDELKKILACLGLPNFNPTNKKPCRFPTDEDTVLTPQEERLHELKVWLISLKLTHRDTEKIKTECFTPEVNIRTLHCFIVIAEAAGVEISQKTSVKSYIQLNLI